MKIIQSTDTFKRSCKTSPQGQNANLKGRNSNISFSRQPQQDSFEGTRTPAHAPSAAKPKAKDVVKTVGTLGLGIAALAIGFMPKASSIAR